MVITPKTGESSPADEGGGKAEEGFVDVVAAPLRQEVVRLQQTIEGKGSHPLPL